MNDDSLVLSVVRVWTIITKKKKKTGNNGNLEDKRN